MSIIFHKVIANPLLFILFISLLNLNRKLFIKLKYFNGIKNEIKNVKYNIF
jgi:hypothetical protein